MTCSEARAGMGLVLALVLGIPAAAQDGPPGKPPDGITSDLVDVTGQTEAVIPDAADPGADQVSGATEPVADGITVRPLPPAQIQARTPGPASDPAERTTGTASATSGVETEAVQPEDVIPNAADPAEPGPSEIAEAGTAGQPAPGTGTDAEPGLDRAGSNTAMVLLTSLWREAVAGGATTLGFKDWLAEALGGDPGAGPDNRTRAPLPEDQAGRTRLVSERWLARAGPVALGEAGRVVTTFGSAIPTVFCAPFMVCYIELEPGEVLTNTPSSGDSVRWQVVVKSQGRDPATVVIEVKPGEDAQVTNLVIPTDRRLYTINLVNDPEVHTPILSFLYPDSAARRIAEEIAAREAADVGAKAAAEQKTQAAAAARAAELKRSGVQTATGNVEASRLDFGFRIDGKAAFRPVRVFADGRRTYIDLHPAYRGALPVIIAGPGEANKALNTRVAQDGSRLVADRVISDIWLQSGKKRVRIRRAAR